MKEVYFGAGCFWGGQAYFDQFKGVIKTEVGYANGDIDKTNPTYKEVCEGKWKFIEVVKVVFNENIITFSELFNKYYSIINPFSLNKQGNDIGVQYKSQISSLNEDILNEARTLIKAKQIREGKKIRIEVSKLINYYVAEEEHQDYLKKNPNGYCHIKLN